MSESKALTAKAVPILTIDGPSGSGKGTVCYRIAKRLGWHLLDSGALYRILALASEQKGIDTQDEVALEKLAEQLSVAFDASHGEVRPLLDGQPVDHLIRTEAVGKRASDIASLPGVRRGLLERQKAFHQPPGLVADGRDMGTIVFPQAQIKIYLTASAEVRAQRRYLQLQDKGHDASLRELTKEICARDERDMNRSTAPLKPAVDAFIVDSSDKPIDEVVDIVWHRVHTILA